MEIKDISLDEKTLEKLRKTGKPWNTSIEKVGKEKLDSLKKTIAEIEFLIEERENLSKNLISEAENIKIDISNFFVQNPTGVQEIREKIALKQKQVDISELQLNEKIDCWQDVAKLKQELREKQKELTDKESRFDMLDKILEE
ncbi:MAG: hypothetical protein PHH54_06180 [Candidatus Nanoarchaeia archaeon]|nr:hypothetical protein [Candidatus Nanoarchaeia archaeon]MDD5741542.1 hypothetical protein [Candidatus Nanoarchaeia archaeon]